VTAEQWAEYVEAGNDVWRQTLSQQTAGMWFHALERYDHEIIFMALGDLAQTCSSWPDLATILEQVRYHLRARGGPRHHPLEEDEDERAPRMYLREWLDAGAPTYPDGEEAARKVWRMFAGAFGEAGQAPEPGAAVGDAEVIPLRPVLELEAPDVDEDVVELDDDGEEF
jgi:hypothetical protein